MKTRRPFFIVGSPRSGTTLLQAMFMAVPGLYLPPETHFWPIVERCRRRDGPPSSDRGRRSMIDAILAVCRRHEIDIDAGRLAGELAACPPTTADLFDTLLWHISSSRPGCRRVGEKSPAHLAYVQRLLESFPDAQAITIIRDARDVALSQQRSLSRSTLRSALGWRRDQRLHARYAAQLPPDRYASVRYEDLVRHPRRELERLCRFLGEPFDDAMLEPHRRPEPGFASFEKHKALTLEPVTADRIGRYRTRLSASRIALVEAVAGAELAANGYELVGRSRIRGYALGACQLPGLIATQVAGKRR